MTSKRELLTVVEFCSELGISRSTFYEWRAKRKGPRAIVLPSGSLRIRRTEVERYLAAHEEPDAASGKSRRSAA